MYCNGIKIHELEQRTIQKHVWIAGIAGLGESADGCSANSMQSPSNNSPLSANRKIDRKVENHVCVFLSQKEELYVGRKLNVSFYIFTNLTPRASEILAMVLNVKL